MATGYSKRPLTAKLGIKPGQYIAILDPPDGYADTLGALPDDVTLLDALPPNGSEDTLDFIHLFSKERTVLAVKFPAMKRSLTPNGMLWISWPKRASKVQTDLDENVVREIGLENGLVDVKVAAIDEVWSGLKFVYRLVDRK